MQEELNQFIANDVWELVLQPRNMTIIGTKWVFRNKLDEKGIVSRNKARLVAQGYNQQEGINYDETYASVARLESIRILLAYACALDFKLFQMDVKSAFLKGFMNEEVYVAQPLGFIDLEKPDHVYKLKKDLYGLKQAPKALYDRLKAFLIKHEYKIGMVDNTLFTKKKSLNLVIVQIYVDDIIFGSACQNMCDEFGKIMHDEFEMSMTGELNFFLGLQIKQIEDGSISCLVSAFALTSNRLPKPLTLKRLSVSSDTLKKQTALGICTIEAEHVSAEKACQQALWIKQALIDYDVRLDDIPIIARVLGYNFVLQGAYGCILGCQFCFGECSAVFSLPVAGVKREAGISVKSMVNTHQSTPEFFGPAFDEAVQRAVNALLPGLTAQITNKLRQNGAGSNDDQLSTIVTPLFVKKTSRQNLGVISKHSHRNI
nr:copia protein [Tanacetum cinerariifolium]